MMELSQDERQLLEQVEAALRGVAYADRVQGERVVGQEIQEAHYISRGLNARCALMSQRLRVALGLPYIGPT